MKTKDKGDDEDVNKYKVVRRDTLPASFNIGDLVDFPIDSISKAIKNKGQVKFTNDLKIKFLKLYAKYGVVGRAAAETGISTNTIHKTRKADPVFAEAVETIREHLAGILEMEAFRRGVEGVDKPVHFKGELTDYVREYSDTILMAMLSAYDERYRKKSMEVTGNGGGPVEIVITRRIVDADGDADEY